MLIALDPIALTVGPLAVRWSGLLAVAGLGLAIWRSLRALDRERLPRKAALDALAWALPAGLISARVVHLLGWWDYYLAHGAELWQFSLDGLSLWGGLVGGGLIGFARLRSRRDPRLQRRILDAVAPNLALGIALGRLGAFLDGHGQGVPSDLPWATQYAHPLAATPDFGVARHPAQLYDASVALALGAVLSAFPRRWPAGSRVAAFLVLYSLARLALGALRLDPAFLFGLQIEQILALGGLGFGLWYGLAPVLRQSARASAAAASASREPAVRATPGPAAARPRHPYPHPRGSPDVPLAATLYMKPGCHLCEVAESDLDGLRSRYPHTLEVVDINTDHELVRQYWDRIPVLRVGGREYDAPLVPAVLQQALLAAAADADDAAADADRAAANKVPGAAPPAKAELRRAE